MYAEEQGAASEPSTKYDDVVPNLVTMSEFLAANALAAENDRLMVLKFYSKRCPACLRIAAKYRRLAINYREHIDCYEAELKAARPLLERLEVSPSTGVWPAPTLL